MPFFSALGISALNIVRSGGASGPTPPPIFSFGNALKFDGVNDYVGFPDEPLFEGRTTLTMSLWAKIPTSGDFQIGSRPSATDVFILSRTAANTNGLVIVNRASGSGAGSYQTYNSTKFDLYDEWAHLVVVFEGSNPFQTRLKLYVNGVYTGYNYIAPQASTVMGDIDGSFEIGAVTALGVYTEGEINEVGIWHGVLTDEEIVGLYNDGFGDFATNYQPEILKRYYRFNGSGEDSTLIDEGLDGVDGTLNGFTRPPEYWVEGQSNIPLFLDLFPEAAAAFSYYKLRRGYSGNCIKIRRTDNAELDVGFVDDYIDTDAIATFCGASDGFLSIDYDQSTNGNNKEQIEGNMQPKIYDGATGMMMLNGKESKRYEMPHVMNLATPILVNSAFIVNNAITLNSVNYIFGTNLNGLNGLISKGSAGGVNGLSVFSGGLTTLGNAENNNQKLHILTNNATNTFLAINGDALSSFTKTNNVYASSVGNRQSDAPSFGALDGNIQFEAYYTTDQSSNVAGIQNLLNSLYSIY